MSKGKKVWEELKNQIERGLQGYNVGLPMGFERLSYHIANLQQGRYDCIGGATGTGKTALVDSAYVFHPYDHLMENEDNFYSLEIIYYSLEIDPVIKVAKWACRKLWEDEGILTNTNELFSKGLHKIPKEVIPIIDKYEKYFGNLQDNVLYFRNSLNPDYLYSDIMNYAESRGEVIKNDNGIVINYIPKNPNLITLIIVDHVGLINRGKKDKSDKEAIDRASQMLVFFRNTFGFSPVAVSQFNRGIEQMDRKENDAQEPQLSDFKDTGATQEDANTVIALFNPFRYGMNSHRGYPVNQLKRRYRSAHILKNRDGMDNLTIGLHFMGEIGKFKELPKAKELEENPQLLQKILNYGKV